MLSTGRSEKNDPNDAGPSVAVAALRSKGLRTVERADHTEIMRLLAKRNHDLGAGCGPSSSAGSTTPRPSSHLEELPRNSTFLMPIGFSAPSSCSTPIEHMRHQLALELVDDVARLDEQIKESHRRIRIAVRASKTSLTDLFGVGPVLACSVIGYSGDVGRFANRDSYAAYAGIAPVEHSSGGRVFHRLSLRGHRRLNNAIHMVAICQIRQPHSQGRAYFERKVAEGKTKREALRSLQAPREQRPLSPVGHRLRKGSGRTLGNDS